MGRLGYASLLGNTTENTPENKQTEIDLDRLKDEDCGDDGACVENDVCGVFYARALYTICVMYYPKAIPSIPQRFVMLKACYRGLVRK